MKQGRGRGSRGGRGRGSTNQASTSNNGGRAVPDFLDALEESEKEVAVHWVTHKELCKEAREKLPDSHRRWCAVRAALQARGTELEGTHGTLWEGLLNRIGHWHDKETGEDLLLLFMRAWARGNVLVQAASAAKSGPLNCRDLEEVFHQAINKVWDGPKDTPFGDNVHQMPRQGRTAKRRYERNAEEHQEALCVQHARFSACAARLEGASGSLVSYLTA